MATAATQHLMDDHRIIEKAVSALRKAADNMEHGRDVSPEFWPQVVDFIRFFSDTWHDAKEEKVLFKLYRDLELPVDQGAIKQMLQDHHESRMIVDRLEEMALSMLKGNHALRPMVIQHAREYANLLTQHIEQEDLLIYPMGENLMTPAHDEKLLKAYQAIEEQLGGARMLRKYIDLVTGFDKMVS